jgi:di/tricarboxylate transporter
VTPDQIFVLALVAGSVVLFVTEVVTVDLVGLMLIAALVLSGIMQPQEAYAGFANEALVTIAAMFALSAALIRTGVLDHLRAAMLALSGGSRVRIVLFLMVTVAISSAFVNNTPVVVIFLPIVLGVASSLDLSPSKLLLPMSYASILGGTCTLVGTSTNLLVAQQAELYAGMHIGMFDFTGPGLVFALAGFLFLALVGHRLLPRRASVSTTVQSGRIREFVTEVLFAEGSPLVGKTYKDLLDKTTGITPLMLIRGDEVVFAPLIADPRGQFIRQGDVLLFKGDPGSINALLEKDGVTLPPELGALLDAQPVGRTVTMVELVINPNSPLIGRTIAGSGFSRRHGGAAAVAVLRHNEHLRRRVSEIRLRLGDTLLVVANEDVLDEIRTSDEFILMEGVDEQVVRRDKSPIALSIMAAVVVLSALEVAPISVLSLTGVAAAVLTRCLPLRLAYSSIDMSIVLLIAGMLCLGQALRTTGLLEVGAHWVVDLLDDYGPLAVMAGIYLLSTLTTTLVSNNAVAVLLTPIAINVAGELGLSPEPFVYAVLFGASASFASPISYQTNLFVYAPGGYRFTDYLRLGIPLNLLLFALSLVVLPWFFPFTAVGS